jgi:hypothetical protein
VKTNANDPFTKEVGMSQRALNRGRSIILALAAGALFAWPTLGLAQTVAGEAKAAQATLLGSTTVLADTGSLSGANDALEASSAVGSVPSLLSADSLHAATIGSAEGTASEASLGSLGLSVGGTTLSADFVMARAVEAAGAPGSGTSEIDGLTINGVPVAVSGAANQTVPFAGGTLILNEQQIGSSGAVVNALHLIVTGVADVVIASATAGTPPTSSGTTPPLPVPPLPGLL